MSNDYDLLTAKFESYYRDLHDIRYLCGQAVRTITGKPRKQVDYPRKGISQHVEDFLKTGVWDKSLNCLPVAPIKKADKNAAYIIEHEVNNIIKFLDSISILINESRLHEILPLDDLTSAGLSRDDFPLTLKIQNPIDLCFAIETTIKQLAAHAQQVHIKMKGVKGGAEGNNAKTEESLEKVKSALGSFGGIDGFKNRDKRPEQYRSFSQEDIYLEIGERIELSPERIKKLIGKLR